MAACMVGITMIIRMGHEKRNCRTYVGEIFDKCAKMVVKSWNKEIGNKTALLER